MSNSGTTAIDALPVNAQGNVTTSAPPSLSENKNGNTNSDNQVNNENVKINNYGQQLNLERKADGASTHIDYSSQLNSVLKEASAAGATVLPSRDIPQTTLSLQQDNQIKPGFIPEANTEDYIGNILDREKIIQENQQKQNQSQNMDYIYQQLQIPLLVGILYFLFQLPIVRKYLLSFLPNLFNTDGNPKLSGYIFNSVIFSLLYVLLVKSLTYFSN